MLTTDTITHVIHALDTMDCVVSDFEAEVLETVSRQLRQGRLPSVKQRRILGEMVEAYLEDPALVRSLKA
jgi:hypothetical protein